MQTKEQWGQFAWELENIKRDLEAFLEMSRDEKRNFRSHTGFQNARVECKAKVVQENARVRF